MSHRIDIIMPMYNVEDYVSTSVLSVLNQSYENFQLIIIDDKSTDASLKIVRELVECDRRISLIAMEENSLGGAGIPSNIGIEASDADFICFLDSDDIYHPNFLKLHYENLMLTNAEVSIGRFNLIEDHVNKIEASYDKTFFDSLYSAYKSLPLKGVQRMKCIDLSPVPWSKMYRKSFFKEKNIRFPEGDFMFEDNPLHWDLCMKADSISLLDKVLVMHRVDRQGQTTTRKDENLLYFIPISNIIESKITNKIERIYFLNWFLREFRWRYSGASKTGKKQLLNAAVESLKLINKQDIVDAKNYFFLSERDTSYISNLKKGESVEKVKSLSFK